MPIFKKTTKEEKKDVSVSTAPVESSKKTAPAGIATHAHLLKHPHITEKGTDLAAHNAYVFDIDPRANKRDVALAIKEVYGVKPLRVCTLPIPRKKVVSRGVRGVKAGGKKAIVYLKDGDKIEFV